MIELEEALEKISERVVIQTKTKRLPITQAVGFVLGEEIIAAQSVPHFNRAGVDGYALRWMDCQGAENDNVHRFFVLGTVYAGDQPSYVGKKDTAVRVMTGGVIPDGYDCVVKQEDVIKDGEEIVLKKQLSKWSNYSSIGEDIQQGSVIMSKGTLLSCNHIGVLASLGIAEVTVISPIKVGLIATGSELTALGYPLHGGKIYNSNSYTILSYIQMKQGIVLHSEICGDDQATFTAKLDAMLQDVDLVITTGAVSVGEKDFLPKLFLRLGGEQLFHRVAVKPGTPVLANIYRGKLILSFSGNPFAALVNFHLFYWFFLSKFMSCPALGLQTKEVIIKDGQAKESQVRRLLRAREDQGEVLLYTAEHHSSVFSNVMYANCLIEQKPGQVLNTGDKVTIYYW